MSLISERNNLKIDDDAEARPERWLLSYSDLVTTLMVLFLTLYALELAKYRELEVKVLESRQSIKEEKNSAEAPASRNAAIEKQASAKAELLSLLKVLSDKGQININEASGGVEIG